MTNIDINVTIICKKIPISIKDDKNINMGGYAERVNITLPLQCEIHNSCKKNYKMNECHANLKEATNYFIQLFYATGQKYSCSRTKLGKLLSILAFLYALDDEELFDETIYRYDGCGTAINELKSYFDRDIYIQFEYEDNREFIKETFNTDNLQMERCFQTVNVDENLKSKIECVFRKFGAYKAYDLGQCINPIVNFSNVTKDNIVNLSVIKTLSRNDFLNVETHNELIDFLFGLPEIKNAE